MMYQAKAHHKSNLLYIFAVILSVLCERFLVGKRCVLEKGMSVFVVTDVTHQILTGKTTRNAKVTNSQGLCSFGVMPILSPYFPQGEIILKLGDRGFFSQKEKKLKAAFGLRHIWDRHAVEIGASSASDVVIFIEKVITQGSEIIFDKKKSPNKPLIVESSTGMVVVELLNISGVPVYSIVTAYTRKGHPGVLLGRL